MTQVGDTPLSFHSTQKKALRAQALSRRRAIPAMARRRAAIKAAESLLRSRLVRANTRIGVYLAHASELDTKPLIDALQGRGIHVFAPSVRRGHRGMMFIRLGETTPVTKSDLRVMQPISHRPVCPVALLDIVIIPVVGFDRFGRRIGQGGGHYDRALNCVRTRRRPKKLGFAYSVQELHWIPDEPWDVKLDGVITERGFRRF